MYLLVYKLKIPMDNWNEDFSEDENENSTLLSILEDEISDVEHVGALVSEYATRYLCKIPCRTNGQTCHYWICEILEGHPSQCYEQFWMQKHIFSQFCTKLVKHGLKRTKQTEVEQMVRVFLSIVGHAEGNRMKQERFQHSGETISRYFHKVLHVYLNLSVEYIKPQDPTFCHVPTKFKDDRWYGSFLRNVIRTIDGTHIQCVVAPSEQPKFIGRKGYPTQDLVVICD